MFCISDAQFQQIIQRSSSATVAPTVTLGWQCSSVKLLLRTQGAVDNGAYVEMASLCSRRIEELKQSAARPRSTHKLGGGLEILNSDPHPITTSDMYQLELVRSGAQMYLTLIKDSKVPTVAATYEDRRLFFDRVCLIPYKQGSIARYIRAFILKYSGATDWCAKLDNDALLITTHLGPPDHRPPFRNRSRSPQRGRENNRDRGRDRGNNRDRDRDRDRNRDRPLRDSTNRARTPPRPKTPRKPLNYCNTRVDQSIGECTYRNCRFDHHCASCKSSATHSAQACPRFDASKATTEADARRRG